MTLPAGGLPNDVAHRWHSWFRGAGGWAGGIYGSFGGGSSAAQLGPLTPVLAPPWVWKPAAATDFNTFATQAGLDTAATPPPGFELAAAGFDIPPGNVGVVRAISLLVNNLLTTSDVRFTLRQDESPIPGWSNLTVNPRAAGSVEVSWTPEETFIEVNEGAALSWVVQVLDGGTYQVSVAMHGWFYPTTMMGS